MDVGRAFFEAWSAVQAGQYDVAEAQIHALIASNPENAQGYLALGMIVAKRGNLAVAIEKMRDALQHEPGLQAAVEWLALLNVQVRDWAQAEHFAQQGLVADPANVQCLKVLGQCGFERKAYSEALEYYERALRIQPKDAQAQSSRGALLRRLHRDSEALEALQEAAKLAPRAEAFVEIAYMQIYLGRMQDSISSSASALSLDPDSYQANLAMARALTNPERWDESERFWVRAESLEQSAGNTRSEKSFAYASLGRFAEAEKEIVRSIEMNPRNGRPYYMLFASRRVSVADQHLVHQAERLLRDDQLDYRDRVYLLYALGKAYDNLSDYETAMNRFDSANALQRSITFGNQPFDTEGFRRWIEFNIGMYTKDFLNSGADESGEQPLFVMGMMRSGTTLVDQILSCHPQVGDAGEQGFWLDYEGTVTDFEEMRIRPEQARRFKSEYMNLLCSIAPGFPQVIDKNPANLVVAGLLRTLFPSSRIICTRRHAVDTVLSIWMTHMRTAAPFMNDRASIVFAYKECVKLMDHWKAAMPSSHYLEVRYEDLVANPEDNIRAMVQFCGLDWNDACLRPELNKNPIRTPSLWQVRRPISNISVDRWKPYERWLGPFAELIGM